MHWGGREERRGGGEGVLKKNKMKQVQKMRCDLQLRIRFCFFASSSVCARRTPGRESDREVIHAVGISGPFPQPPFVPAISERCDWARKPAQTLRSHAHNNGNVEVVVLQVDAPFVVVVVVVGRLE